MGAHLFQMGKRRCTYCKKVKPLTAQHFHKKPNTKHRPVSHQFGYYCKPCLVKHMRRFEYFRFRELRHRVVKSMGLRCGLCGITDADSAFFDVDHIKQPGFKWRKNISKYLLARDRKNLRVLCPNCHRRKTILDRM